MTRKTVLVTGGSRGIGRAICDELSGDYHLLVGGTSSQSVGSVVAELHSAEPFVCDLTQPDELQKAVARISHLDAIVLNAGMAFSSTIASTDHADWQRMLGLNVIAQADLIRMTLPLLRESRGQVVAINSGAGFHSGIGSGPYAASKFALRALTDALREEERGTVRVSSIHPGRVDTDMQVELQTAAGRTYRPSDHLKPYSIARVVRTVLEAPEDGTVEVVSVRPI
ncbi:MAG: SDR family oxidoreductase [Actinomycetaceae bacterium]|nr:SDR family oxidoreductase [Actinomycetaceae bacterium]